MKKNNKEDWELHIAKIEDIVKECLSASEKLGLPDDC